MWETVLAIIASFGGAATIIAVVVKFASDKIADRILQKSQFKYDKKLQDFTAKYDKELQEVTAQYTQKSQELQSKLDKSVHVSLSQYDKEIAIFEDIWEKLTECVIYTNSLYPAFENIPSKSEDLEQYQYEKYKKYAYAYNCFFGKIVKNAPFIDEKFYNDFITLRDKCKKIGAKFYHHEIEKKNNLSYFHVKDEPISMIERKQVIELSTEIDVLQQEIMKEMRKYLVELQVIKL